MYADTSADTLGTFIIPIHSASMRGRVRIRQVRTGQTKNNSMGFDTMEMISLDIIYSYYVYIASVVICSSKLVLVMADTKLGPPGHLNLLSNILPL